VLSEKTEKYLSDQGKACLTKPFSIAELQGAIEEALKKQS
jgi:hypothetical protein